jgi:hypothetical protein
LKRGRPANSADAYLKEAWNAMKVLLFSMYYSGLLLRVLAGYESTTIPLSLNWRWRHWKRRYLFRSDWY